MSRLPDYPQPNAFLVASESSADSEEDEGEDVDPQIEIARLDDLIHHEIMEGGKAVANLETLWMQRGSAEVVWGQAELKDGNYNEAALHFASALDDYTCAMELVLEADSKNDRSGHAALWYTQFNLGIMYALNSYGDDAARRQTLVRAKKMILEALGQRFEKERGGGEELEGEGWQNYNLSADELKAMLDFGMRAAYVLSGSSGLDWESSLHHAELRALCLECAGVMVRHAEELSKMEPVSNTNVVAAIEEARAWDQGVDARAELESKYMRKCASPACGAFGARLRCSRCKEAVYCSSDCQKQAWKTHRLACQKPTLEQSA